MDRHPLAAGYERGRHAARQADGEAAGAAAENLGDDETKALMAHVKSSLSTAKLKALVENAQSEDGIPVQPDQLDVDPWLLNCANGTLDLRTGDLRSHRQEDMLTKCLAIVYDPEVRYPQWSAFLEKAMGSAELIVLCSAPWAIA